MIVAMLMAALQTAGPVGTPIPVAPSIGDAGYYVSTYDHGIAWSGSGDRYLSVFSNGSTWAPQAVLVNAATGVAGAPITLPGTFATSPAVAWSAARQRFLVVYIDGAYNSPTKVNAVVLDANGSPVGGATPIRLNGDETVWTLYSTEVRVASDGDGWLVAWLRYDFNDDYAVRGRVVGGASTNAAPVLVTAAFDIQPHSNANQIDVAFGAGSSYLVAWDNGDAEGRTVSPAGALGTLQTYGPEIGLPTLTANAALGEFVVASASATAWDTGAPALLRVGADGAPVGTPVAFAGLALPGSAAAVWNAAAAQYLAAWIEDDGSGSGTFRGRAVRLNPDLSTVAAPFTVAEGVYTGVQWYARMVGASRATGTQVILQWDADGGGDLPLAAQRYDLGQNPGTPSISDARQYQVGSSQAIDAGGLSRWAGFSVRATLSNAAGDALKLQVEVQQEGQAFTGTPTASGALLPSGSSASIDIDLATGHGYRWQARAVSAKGLASTWMPFGSESDIDLVVPGDVTGYVPPPLGSSAEKKACTGSSAAEAGVSILLMAISLAALLRR